jgi:tripartite-type tricarboxylate transporter receptor subunit TctC
MMTTRRTLLAALGATTLLPTYAQSPSWPTLKPVSMVVPYGPAGAPDAMTRLISEVFKKRFGQTFVVENRPGAGANVGVGYVAKAKPDGYTLVSAPVGAFAINEFLYEKLPYSSRDLVPISTIYEIPNVFAVPMSIPANTVAEYVEYLRKRGKGITFGSPGVGNSAHLWGELFRSRIGIEGLHSPFTSGQQVVVSMLQGDVDFVIDVLASYRPYLQGGKLKALAVTGSSRSPLFPDVPTMEESGFPGFDLMTWVALAAPRDTPAEVIAALSNAQQELAKDPEMQKQFANAGVRIASSTPEGLALRIEKERPRWQQLVKMSGAKIN